MRIRRKTVDRVTTIVLSVLASIIAIDHAEARDTRKQREAALMALRSAVVAVEDGDYGGAGRDRLRADLTAAMKNFPSRDKALLTAELNSLEASKDPVKAAAFRGQLLKASQVDVAPAQTPKGDFAATTFARQCAACHGGKGEGDGKLVAKMDRKPAPVSTLQKSKGSPFRYLNILLLGRPGTTMPSYKEKHGLEDLWSLAFHFASLPYGGPTDQDKASTESVIGTPLWTMLLRRGLNLALLSRSTDSALEAWLSESAPELQRDETKRRRTLAALRTVAAFDPKLPRGPR